MRILVLAAFMTIIAAPVFGQPMGTAIPLHQDKEVSPETAAKRRATEEAYKSTIKNIPEAKANDPWGNMRSVDTGAGNAGKAKPAAKKTN